MLGHVITLGGNVGPAESVLRKVGIGIGVLAYSQAGVPGLLQRSTNVSLSSRERTVDPATTSDANGHINGHRRIFATARLGFLLSE